MSIQYKNSDILTVPNVAALFSIKNIKDNQLVQTLGYSTEGVGANLYRYDMGSSATIDGGFVLPGSNGTLSFSGTTFNGNAGDGGRFIAVDQTVADVTQFSAIGNGSTDDTNAIQRAASSSQGTDSTLRIPPGTYSHGTITITDGITIRCEGVLRHTKDSGKISIEMPFGSAVSCVVADQALISGSQVVYTHKITAVGHGLVKGDYLKFIRSSASAGEIAKVLEVIDSDNFTIDHAMEEISAGDSGVVYYTMPTGRLDIQLNITSDGVDGTWPTAHAALDINGAIHPMISVKSEGILKTGVQLRSVAGGVVNYSQRDNGDAISTTNTENRLGYGVVVASGTAGTQVNLDVEGGRHAFTTGTGIATVHYGEPVDVVVTGVVRNSHSAAFDTHAEGRRITFRNCTASFSNTLQTGSGVLPIGFQNRSKDTIYQNVSVHSAKRGFELISTTPDSVVTIQNAVIDGTTHGGIVCNEDTSSVLLIDGYTYRDTTTSSGALGFALGTYGSRVKAKNCYFSMGTSTSQAVRMSGDGVVELDSIDHEHATSGGPALVLYSVTSGNGTLYVRGYRQTGNAAASLLRVSAGTLNYYTSDINCETQFTALLPAVLSGTGAVVSLNKPYSIGNSGTSKNIFFGAYRFDQSITLSANCTFTFFAPPHPTTVRLVVTQDGTGGRTITWPTINWKSSAIQPDATASSTSVFEFYYDGTSYHEMNVNN